MTASREYVLSPDELDTQQRDLYASLTEGPRGGTSSKFEITDAEGALRGPFAAMLLAPHIGDAVQRFGVALRFQGALDDRLRETAILVVARTMASVFEWSAHELVAREAGLTDLELDALRRGDSSTLPRRERRCAEFVRDLLSGSAVRATSLTDDFTAAQLYELSALVGYYRMLATQLHLFELDETASPRHSSHGETVDDRPEGLQ